jgi:hypothetical protein
MKRYRLMALGVALVASSQAHAEWQLMDGSEGLQTLRITGNSECQPRRDEKHTVGSYVVDVAAFASCNRWIVSIEDFKAAFVITTSKSDMKAAQAALIQVLERQGGTDSQLTDKKLAAVGPEPIHIWAAEQSRAHSDTLTAYAAAKAAMPSIEASCPDAIAIHEEPSAPRYASAYNSAVKIFSHQCNFVVSYEPIVNAIDVSDVQAYSDSFYEYCRRDVEIGVDATCANAEKEVTVLSQFRH